MDKIYHVSVTEEDLLTTPIINNSIVKMIDIKAPELGVQIKVSDGKLWVNVDGMCVLRVYDSPVIEVEND